MLQVVLVRARKTRRAGAIYTVTGGYAGLEVRVTMSGVPVLQADSTRKAVLKSRRVLVITKDYYRTISATVVPPGAAVHS